MRVYDQVGEDRRVFAFEVSGGPNGPTGLSRIVRFIDNVSVLEEATAGAAGQDAVVCGFEVDGIRFAIHGPNADGRYRIGPTAAGWVPQIEKVRRAFLRAKPIHAFMPAWMIAWYRRW